MCVCVCVCVYVAISKVLRVTHVLGIDTLFIQAHYIPVSNISQHRSPNCKMFNFGILSSESTLTEDIMK